MDSESSEERLDMTAPTFVGELELTGCFSAPGYIIYYSTDVNAEDHDWVIEPVVGNRLTHQIQELTLDTTYYFKIQARNSKGMGPMSEAVHFRTPKSKSACLRT